MGGGCAGCAGGMLLSAACRAVVVRSCAGMGTASLWSPVAEWVFARVRGVVVSLLVCAVAGPAVLYCIAVLTRVQGSISARIRDMSKSV
jgi:hypothetical protein